MELYIETHSITSSACCIAFAGPEGSGWTGPEITYEGRTARATWTRAPKPKAKPKASDK